MIQVKINKAGWEYDIHSLVKAFYPEETVKVLTPESVEKKPAEKPLQTFTITVEEKTDYNEAGRRDFMDTEYSGHRKNCSGFQK